MGEMSWNGEASRWECECGKPITVSEVLRCETQTEEEDAHAPNESVDVFRLGRVRQRRDLPTALNTRAARPLFDSLTQP